MRSTTRLEVNVLFQVEDSFFGVRDGWLCWFIQGPVSEGLRNHLRETFGSPTIMFYLYTSILPQSLTPRIVWLNRPNVSIPKGRRSRDRQRKHMPYIDSGRYLVHSRWGKFCISYGRMTSHVCNPYRCRERTPLVDWSLHNRTLDVSIVT